MDLKPSETPSFQQGNIVRSHGLEFMIPEDPWPRKGDVLFVDGGDWLQNACVGWSGDEWHGYAEGYRRAAELLVQHVADG